MEFSSSPHRPTHLYLNNACYLVTASTLNHIHFFSSADLLKLWQETLFNLVNEFQITLGAWVLLPNHYHILVQMQNGRDIGKIIGRLHGKTSREINLIENKPGRKIWYSYWDTCLRGEHDFWARLNYVHFNPVKHGYVKEPEDWVYSSYRSYLESDGLEWLMKLWADFPMGEMENDKF
jgi:putative transposase